MPEAFTVKAPDKKERKISGCYLVGDNLAQLDCNIRFFQWQPDLESRTGTA